MNSLFSLYSPASATAKILSTPHAQDPSHPHTPAPSQTSRPFSKICRALSDIGGLSLDQYLIRSFEDRDLNLLDVYGRQNLEISDAEGEEEYDLGRGDNEGRDGHADLRLTSIMDEDGDEEEETSLMVLVGDDTDAVDQAGKDSLPDREESLIAEREGDDEGGTNMEEMGSLGVRDRAGVVLASSNVNPNIRMQVVERLHRTCHKAFGNSDALHFDFVEDNGPNSKQCILTITRPNGSVRSYKTDPVYTKKSDAKVEAASLALERGALDFILNGDSEALKARKGELLAPLDASRVSDNSRREVDEQDTSEVDGAIAEIEKCCLEWRAGLVKPFWVAFSDTKLGTRWGAAMRIKLTPNCYRVYSTDIIHPSSIRARLSCAEEAIAADALNFIKYGNGQTQPAIASEADTPVDDTLLNGNARNIIQYTHRKKSMSLQEYYENLPQPFPGVDGDKTAQDINAPAWLNTALQSSRGSKLKMNFHYFLDSTIGLYGCLLRIDRPSEVKSYLVDSLFVKRGDARSAVCLLAISSGVGEYIQQVKEETDKKMTYDRRKANEIIHFLHMECAKIRAGSEPTFVFEKDRDAHGCSLKIDVSASFSTPNLHTYTSPVEFRNKADAKAAVACIAAEQGVVELVRFRGKSPPDGYVPYSVTKSLYSAAGFGSGSKRKKAEAEREADEGHESGLNGWDENRKRLNTKKLRHSEATAKKPERDGPERSNHLNHQLKPKAGFGAPQGGHNAGGNGRAGAGLIPTGPAKRNKNGRQLDFDASWPPIRLNTGPGYQQAQSPSPHVQTNRLPPTAPRALRYQQRSPVTQSQLQPQATGQYHQSYPPSHPQVYTQFPPPPPEPQSPPTSTVAPHFHPAAWSVLIGTATHHQQQHHAHYSQPYQIYQEYEHAGYPAYSPPPLLPPPIQSYSHQPQSYQAHYQNHSPDGMAYGAYMPPPPPPPLPPMAPQYVEMESYPYGQSHENRYNASYEYHAMQQSGRVVWPPGGVARVTKAPGPQARNAKGDYLEEGELGEHEREQRDVPQYLDYGGESEGEEDMVTSSRGSTPACGSNEAKLMDSSSVKVPSPVAGMEGHEIDGKGACLGNVSDGVGGGDSEADRLREIVRRKRRKFS